MMTEHWPIILQTIVIVMAIIATVRHSEKRMSTMETKVEHLEKAVKPIPGISRALAQLKGQINK